MALLVPPMSTEAFTAGRLRLTESLGSERRRRVAGRLAGGIWAIALVLLTVPLTLGPDMLDLQVYRNGGLAWLRGIPL